MKDKKNNERFRSAIINFVCTFNENMMGEDAPKQFFLAA